MSWYVSITAAPDRPRWAASGPLLSFLAEQPELVRTAPAGFGPVAGAPWVVVSVAACDSPGCYSVGDGPAPPEADIVEVCCSHAHPQEWYDGLAGRIAAFLGWVAVEERDGRRVWPPA